MESPTYPCVATVSHGIHPRETAHEQAHIVG